MSGRIISGGEILDYEPYIDQSNTACRMPKSGGDRKMAKGQKEFSQAEKIKHFQERVNDMSLSQGQRNYAAQRLSSLTGVPVVAPQAPVQQNRSSSAPQQRGNSYSRNNARNGAPNGARSGNNMNVYVHLVK